MSLFGRPVVIFPHSDRPGCLDALRTKLAMLQGCLGAWLVRGLWVAVGMVIGAVVGRGCD